MLLLVHSASLDPVLMQFTEMILCPSGPLVHLSYLLHLYTHIVHTPPVLCHVFSFYTSWHSGHTIKKTPVTCDTVATLISKSRKWTGFTIMQRYRSRKRGTENTILQFYDIIQGYLQSPLKEHPICWYDYNMSV